MKTKTVFACSNCGASYPRWSGQCRSCNEWNTLVEERQVKAGSAGKGKGARSTAQGRVVALREISASGEERLHTGIGELDRVLGGGVVPGSIVLVGGDPGIGKSTLMLQMCAGLQPYAPLYVTGEESLQQIRFRALRLPTAPDDLQLLAETNIVRICDTIQQGATGLVVIDSIQTSYREDIESAPGSVAQVRECAALLMQKAKQSGIPVFLVGHVTKEGMIAGPKVLEHMVDTVLQFEGERVYSYRILRAVKNRYGSTNELGVFEMAEQGLREVANPSELFLSERSSGESGTAVVVAMEGTRPLVLEVQALATASSYGVPQRSATGYDYKRLQMILAILEKRLGLNLGQYDIFVNIAGGLRLDDPAIDLGIAAAIVSSYRDLPIDADIALIGELGLTGEVRAVTSIEARVHECRRLGFRSVMLPGSAMKRTSAIEGIELRPEERIVQALVDLFAGAASASS